MANNEPLSMKTRNVYLVLCLLGFLLPYSQFLPWLMEHGLDYWNFIQELFANRVGRFFGADVILSAITLFVFIGAEGRRLAIKNLWIPVVATVAVGVSLGLPLFLYQREVKLRREP
jgi:hypothetical protein